MDPRESGEPRRSSARSFRKSFGLDLGDLSADTWSLLPGIGDFLAEVRTRRFDTLTYARSVSEVEDISLFDRKNRRNISVYSSRAAHRQRYGRFYDEDDRADYIVRTTTSRSSFDPSRRAGSTGPTRLAIEVRGNAFRLAHPPAGRVARVESVIYSSEFGRLLVLRIRNQNGIVVNLPTHRHARAAG